MAACSRCKGQAERSRAPSGFISLRLHSSLRAMPTQRLSAAGSLITFARGFAQER